MDRAQAKGVLEALLFMATGPVSPEFLQEITGLEAEEVTALLQELAAGLHGLEIVNAGGGYRLCTRPEYAEYVEKLAGRQPPSLSPAALETLAIIAYRQPVTKAEIEDLRGVKVDGVLANLMHRELVQEVGRKEVPGRPVLYGTTRFFLEYFGLNRLDELPALDSALQTEVGGRRPEAGSA